MDHEKCKLRNLFWEATLRCNAGCPFCGSRCGRQSELKEVDSGTLIKTFESIAGAYDAHSIMVNVTGGEPLLRKDLFSVMDKVHQLGFPWGIVTNASLITDETIQSMKKTGMRTISISIDDLFEAHERMRRLPGSFSHIVDSIHSLAQEDFLDTIQITTVVSRENIGSLEKMFNYFCGLPVDSWRLAIVDPIGRCTEQTVLLLRREDLEELFAFFDRHKFNSKPILTTSCSHFLGQADSLYRSHPFRCGAGKNVASILADGSIFVCPNVPRWGEIIQGNIETDDFVSIWENGFKYFRDENSRRTGQCLQCPDWELCKGDSLHTWDFENRRPKFCYREYGLPEQKTIEPVLPPRLKSRYPSLKGIRFSYGSSSSKTVCFSPNAAEQLYCFFHWGKKHPVNICEQMVAAIGHYSEEQAFIEELIPVPLQDRGEQTAAFSMELHKYTLKEVDVMNRNLFKCTDTYLEKDVPLSFLGYIHSHPGELNAAMSQPDQKLHELLNKNGVTPCFTGIINPQKKDLCIYWDSLFSPTHVLLLAEQNDVEKWM